MDCIMSRETCTVSNETVSMSRENFTIMWVTSPCIIDLIASLICIGRLLSCSGTLTGRERILGAKQSQISVTKEI
jgi:hypothetical protein